MNYKEMYEQIKLNSLNESKVIKTNKKRIISSKNLVLIMLMFYIFNLNGYNLNKADNYVENSEINYNVSDIIINNTTNIFEEMEKSGVTFSQNLTFEDYKKIESLNEKDLFSYYSCLGKIECEKVIVALGYNGWDDFLKKNNLETINNWISYEHTNIINSGKKR